MLLRRTSGTGNRTRDVLAVVRGLRPASRQSIPGRHMRTIARRGKTPMKLFTGLHEIACKRADGKLYIGYFDDEQQALAAVGADPSYHAVWYSLNPLRQLPEGATLKGPLVRSTRSKKDWI